VLPLRERFPAPAVMGVVNVTPDSFSDGGAFLDPADAIAHGLELAAEGADVLDVGGESTRPGSDPVPLEVELERVLPVIDGLARQTDVPISIDTVKAEVAEQAIRAGAALVNDVTALRHDPAMAEVVAAAGVPVCLMHMLGEPKTMQDDPHYDDVVAEVSAFLTERIAFTQSNDIDPNQIYVDPRIGFGKTIDHNLALLRHLDRIAAIGPPVLVGASRKSFLGVLTGQPLEGRDIATVAVNLAAVRRGAWMLRVHAVRPTRDALAVSAAIEAVA